MTKQSEILPKIITSLKETIENEIFSNESTLKHHFFYYLKLKNKKYRVSVEEDLNKHINFNGRADYYLDDKSKSYRQDVAIEFKINCKSARLIKHDLDKLDKIKSLNKFIAPIFINVFTDEINFREYLKKTKKLFYNTKAYVITIAPSISHFFVRNGLEIRKIDLKGTSFIINNERFTTIIPSNNNMIRLPNKGGLMKRIHLYEKGRNDFRPRKKDGTIDSSKYITYCDPIKKE